MRITHRYSTSPWWLHLSSTASSPLAAPFIAAFYNQPLITPVLRVLGLTLFFGAVNTIQNAVIARNFQFRKLFISSLGAVLLSGVVGIAMAYAGYGVWALVGQQLTSIIALCLIMWFTVQWRPKLLFSVTRVKIILIGCAGVWPAR
jgi:teichuronic acid exporter